MKNAILTFALSLILTNIMSQSVDFNSHPKFRKDNYDVIIDITEGTAPFQYFVDGGSYYRLGNIFTFQYGTTYIVTVKDANNRKKIDTLYADQCIFPWTVCVNDNIVEVYTYDATVLMPVFRWFDIDSGVEIESNISVEYPANSSSTIIRSAQVHSGNYAVLVYNHYIDADTVVFVTIGDIVGVNDNETEELKIFPNPTTDYVVFSEIVSEAKVFSMNGSLLSTTRNTDRINLSSLPSGVYLIQIGNLSKKIIKKGNYSSLCMPQGIFLKLILN